METKAPDNSRITICSLIRPPGVSYLMGLALPREAPIPGEHGSFLEGPTEETASPTVETGPELPEKAWGWGWRS